MRAAIPILHRADDLGVPAEEPVGIFKYPAKWSYCTGLFFGSIIGPICCTLQASWHILILLLIIYASIFTLWYLVPTVSPVPSVSGWTSGIWRILHSIYTGITLEFSQHTYDENVGKILGSLDKCIALIRQQAHRF